MPAIKICVAIPALTVGELGLVILMQALVTIGAYVEAHFANARRRKMAYGAIIFRYGKVFPVYVNEMKIFVEPPRAVAAIIMAHHAVLNALDSKLF